jgi:hypothetical protein
MTDRVCYQYTHSVRTTCTISLSTLYVAIQKINLPVALARVASVPATRLHRHQVSLRVKGYVTHW